MKRVTAIITALAIAVCSLCTACSSGGQKTARADIVPPAESLISSDLPEDSGIADEPVDTARVEELLESLSLEQKIAQMIMISFQVWDSNPSDKYAGSYLTEMNPQVRDILLKYGFGALIYYAGNVKDTAQTFRMTQEMQETVIESCGIPMIVAADQEGGTVYRLAKGTALPGNMALGASGDPDTAYTAGRIIASELLSLGINTALAPVADINSNANNPVIGLRSYGDDPQLVGQFTSACIKGMKSLNAAACAKHFPGHGDTATDSHYGLPVVNKSLEELKANELLPFEEAIRNGVDMIMTAHILYPQLESGTEYSSKTGRQESLPATMSERIITDLLKGDMHFDGVVCTDAMNMAGITSHWTAAEAAVIAINAGIDMFCAPVTIGSYDQLYRIDNYVQSIAAAVNEDRIPMERIDDACRRILTLKARRGILDYDEAELSVEKALSTVGCSANKNDERIIAAKGVTVVQNDGILPLTLNKGEKVLMLTPYYNETGLLAIGWNRAKECRLIPDSASIRILAYGKSGGLYQAIDAADKIVIVSEISSGKTITQNSWLYSMPQNLAEYAISKGKKIIVISADKPYDVQLFPCVDAVMCVYGSEGGSVDPTEVLLGGAVRSSSTCGPNLAAGVEVMFGVADAQGKLPVAVPEFNYATNAFDGNILLERGFGLTYDSLLKGRAFYDVGEKDYFSEAVSWAAENGISKGTRENFFDPFLNVSRGQFVTFLWRAAGCPETDADIPFTDIKAGSYYEEPVRWAAANRITSGKGNGIFDPDADISREELACLLFNYVKTTGGADADNAQFNLDQGDASDISRWAADAMQWCVKNNIIRGSDKNLLMPQANADRAQALCMLQRMITLDAK